MLTLANTTLADLARTAISMNRSRIHPRADYLEPLIENSEQARLWQINSQQLASNSSAIGNLPNATTREQLKRLSESAEKIVLDPIIQSISLRLFSFVDHLLAFEAEMSRCYQNGRINEDDDDNFQIRTADGYTITRQYIKPTVEDQSIGKRTFELSFADSTGATLIIKATDYCRQKVTELKLDDLVLKPSDASI